jgi:2-hydroxychromene-2-carboxylate isomerase
MPLHIDFFISLASTYTYLAVNRAEAHAEKAGVALRWRPFSVRTIMTEQNNKPFAGKPVKMAYMWRDLERRAQRHGIAFRSIPPYPVDADGLANRVAALAAVEGWCPAFAKASYDGWFLGNGDPGDVENLSRAVLRTGRDPGETIARANSPDIHAKLAAETDAARTLGIFGSPTFVCGTELFWGDDRLEEAIEWCTSHEPVSTAAHVKAAAGEEAERPST